MEVGGQTCDPAALPPPERDWVPILREVEWGAGTVWTGVKTSPSPRIHPLTVKPVAGRYAY